MTAALLLTGCSSNQRMLADLRAHPTLRGASELQGLAYFPQQEDQCGPASLATLLVHNGIETSPEALRPRLYIPAKGGTLGIELAAGARRYGLVSYPLAPNLEDLLLELDAGHPVLVMQNLGFRWLPQWHFAVAFGYNLQQQVVLLRSGANKRYSTDLTLFKRTWDNAGNWAQVILPPTELPATATLTRYMQAANALEQTGQAAAAQLAYSSADQRWPDTPMILMGLGNISYARQAFAASAGYFKRYIAHAPDPAAGWNNLAYSLQAIGCPDSALAAARCAVASAPQNPAYAASLREFSPQTAAPPSLPHCQLPPCAALP